MPEQRTSIDAIIALWRRAAEVIASDTNGGRRQAYQAVAEIVHRHLQSSEAATLDAIIALFGRGELHIIAIRDAMRLYGKTLNADVIVGAACWQHLASLIANHIIADVA